MKLTIVVFLLTFFTILSNIPAFSIHNIATSQPNLTPAGESNVTKDMINLLSDIAGASTEIEEEISNNLTNQIYESIQQNKSTPYLSYIAPESFLLDGITLSENSFMPIYETYPYFISEGHLSANLPCNENYNSTIDILVGQIPNLKSVPLEPIYALSDPGEICTYQISLFSNDTGPISLIAIQNNSTEDIELPTTSTIIMGVSKLANNNTTN